MTNKFFQNIIDTNPQHLKDEVAFHIAFAKKVREILSTKKMTQKGLAQELDKQPSEVSKLLSGKHNLTISSIFKIAAALEEPLIKVIDQPGKKPLFTGNCKVYSLEKPMREVNFKEGVTGVIHKQKILVPIEVPIKTA